MADKTYIQFTGRLKATSQEGILAEAQQIAISGSDNTNVKKYIDDKISSVNNNIGSVAGSVYRPKGSITFAGLKALTSATAGDVYNVTDAFTLGSKSYPAGSNVACLKSFSSAVTPDETYWDVLAGFVDLSPYAKTSEVNTIKGNLEKSISDNVSTLTSKVGTAQATANEASSAASTNAGEITKINTRVSSLEGVGAQANVIESVKVNGSALPVSNKSVNVDLTAYAQTTELDKRINLNSEYGDDKSVSIFNGAVKLFVGTDVGTDAQTEHIKIGDGVVIGNAVEIYTASAYHLKIGTGEYSKKIANVEDLNSYVQKESGKGLSSNDYTSAEKTKLAGIASSAQVNVIESVKVNGSALAVANKAVNIDLSSYAKGSDVDRLKKMTKKFVVLPFTFGIEIGTPTFEQSSITLTGEATVYYSKAGKTFYVVSNMKNYSSWGNAVGHPGKVEYNDENILFIETTTKELYMKTADGLVLCNQSLVSGYATTSALKAAENRITALENLLKLA
jgi:hypothetical protein